jgi:PST family polysaccharide transporter
VYAVAYKLPELAIGSAMWVFSSVAFPAYSKVRSRGTEAFSSFALRSLTLVTGFSFPVAAILALGAQDLVAALFPGEWSGAAAPMTLIAAALAFDSIAYAISDIFPALGRPGVMVKLNAVMAVALLGGFLFTARYGLMGIALTHVVVLFGWGGLRLWLVGDVLDLRWREMLGTMRPGLWAAAGAVTLGLPIRLLCGPGGLRLLAIGAASGAGALIGVRFGAPELLDGVRQLARTDRAAPARS